MCVGTDMDKAGRSRPDPLVGVSDLATATLEAMRDLSFVMHSCLYICFYVFSYV